MLTARQTDIVAVMARWPGYPDKYYARLLGLSELSIKGQLRLIRMRVPQFFGGATNRILLFQALARYADWYVGPQIKVQLRLPFKAPIPRKYKVASRARLPGPPHPDKLKRPTATAWYAI